MIQLPCLSVRQPWANIICAGLKDVENRTWNTGFRGTFLVHAGKAMTASYYDEACEMAVACGIKRQALPPRTTLDRGGIVGAAELLDVLLPGSSAHHWHQSTDPSDNLFGFLLGRRITLPFRALRGALTFFKVELTKTEAQALRKAGLPLTTT